MSTPMGRDEVLAVLDNEIASYKHIPFLLRDGVTVDFTEAVDRLANARAAVAALYDELESFKLSAEQLNHALCMQAAAHSTACKVLRQTLAVLGHPECDPSIVIARVKQALGTEPSDAEGGE